MFVHVILLAALQDPDLAPESKLDDVGFALRPPSDWKQVDSPPPAIFKLVAPEGKLAKGSLLAIKFSPEEPMTAKSMGAKNVDWYKRNYAGFDVKGDEELKVGGFPAHRTAGIHKETACWRVSVERSPSEFYFLDLQCDAKSVDAGAALLKKVIDSVRFWTPELTKEERDGAAAAAAALKGAKLPPATLGDSHFLVTIAGRILGSQKLTISEGDAVEFESAFQMQDSAGGRRQETVKGSFKLDGSLQKQTSEAKEGGKRAFRAVTTIENRRALIQRTIGGATTETVMETAPATYLDTIADIVRSVLATKGKASYAIHILSPFGTAPASDLLEVADAEKVSMDGHESVLRIVLSKSFRYRQRTFIFEEDGRFRSVKTPGVAIEIRRCTKEEYEKVNR
jgi:hypothetical protein